MARRWWVLGGGAVLVLGVLAVVLVLVGRGADRVHRLDAGDDGSVLELAVGEQVVLELEGNPTTGYAWQVAEVDPEVLAPAGAPDYQSSSDAEGAGGTFTFRFDAVGRGETRLVLRYFPSWEQPTPESGAFTVTVVVD